MMTLAQQQGDYFIIGLLAGTQALGYYVIGFRLFDIIRELISGTIQTIGLPAFSRMNGDKVRISRAILSITRVSATIALPIFAGAGALAGHLVPLLFGPNWDASVPVMQWLTIVGVLSSITFLDRSAMIALGKMRTETIVTFLAVAKNIVAFVIGSNWGINGVAAAYAIAVLAFWPVRLFTLRNATGLSLKAYLGQWLRPLTASLGMVAVILLIQATLPDVAQLPVSIVAGGATYIGIMALIGKTHLAEATSTAGAMLPKSLRKRFGRLAPSL
jgi:teichuronic acid exporter